MTFQDFQKAIAPLAMLKKEVKDLPTWKVYHRALVKEPAPTPQVFARALVLAALRKWFPTPGELRADCETERQALLKSHPYEPCELCHHTGWQEVVKNGASYVTRCSCHAAYRVALARLGCGDSRLVQPALGEPDPENYRV